MKWPSHSYTISRRFLHEMVSAHFRAFKIPPTEEKSLLSIDRRKRLKPLEIKICYNKVEYSRDPLCKKLTKMLLQWSWELWFLPLGFNQTQFWNRLKLNLEPGLARGPTGSLYVEMVPNHWSGSSYIRLEGHQLAVLSTYAIISTVHRWHTICSILIIHIYVPHRTPGNPNSALESPMN